MNRLHTVWAAIYRRALAAFPRDFRARWGPDMELAFRDRLEGAQHSRLREVILVAREVVNLLTDGIRERIHTNTGPLRMLHIQDIRYAVRLLTRSPGFTLLTVLVLAGGLGLSTFTFSFLYTAMMRPLPLGEGDRIVRIDPVLEGRRYPVDAIDVGALRAAVASVGEMGGYSEREVVVGLEGERRVVDATVADPLLFGIARTPALLGRSLIPSDAEDGAEPVVVLSFRTWEVAFGADRDIVNKRVELSGVSTRVIGVMPQGFGFPVASEAWLPLPARTMTTTEAGLLSLRLVGRMGKGVTPSQVVAEATPVLQRAFASRDTSVKARGVGALVESFPKAQFGEERTLVFTALNLAAALILLLALVNVTNLLLARANERIRETAVRLALGASAGRLVMQGLWETVLVCLAGGVVGTAGASWGLDAITRWTQANIPANLAFWWVWQMDGVTLLCAGVFVTVAIATLGVVVSHRVMHTNVRQVMQDGNARAGSRHEGRLSRALVQTQVTTVTVLMFAGVMAGIMAQRAVNFDPGYDVTNLLQAGISPPDARYGTREKRQDALRNVHARLAEHEAFERVVMRLDVGEKTSPTGRFATRDAGSAGTVPTAYVRATLGDLSALGARVVEGRAFDASDDTSRAPVALVSQSLAARYWRGRSPVGDQLRLAGIGDTLQWRTIVGVTSDVMLGNPLSRDRSPDGIYVPLLQSEASRAVVLARYRVSEVAGREGLSQAYSAVDPLLVPDTVQPFAEVMRSVGLIAVSVTRLFGACLAFALVLALAGTYGLMSRSIGLRRREIGVRRALGASDAIVTRLLLAQGGRQLGVGTLIAAPFLIVGGLGFMHFFPVGGWLTLVVGVGVSVSIIALVLGSTWLPTRKVLRVTPRDALWSD